MAATWIVVVVVAGEALAATLVAALVAALMAVGSAIELPTVPVAPVATLGLIEQIVSPRSLLHPPKLALFRTTQMASAMCIGPF